MFMSNTFANVTGARVDVVAAAVALAAASGFIQAETEVVCLSFVVSVAPTAD